MEGVLQLWDTAIHFYVWGTRHAKTLVLLHGNGEDHHIFADYVPRWQTRYQVITIDTRGHGDSGKGRQPWDFKLFAEDVALLIKKLGVAPAAVLGFSDGGNTAIHLALQYPQTVEAAILVGANLQPEGLRPWFRAGVALRYLRYTLMAPFSARIRRSRELYALMINEPRLKPGQLKHVAVPVLVVSGTKDVIRRKHSEAMVKNLPKGQLCYEDHADHFAMFHQVGKYQKIFDEFLESVWNQD